MQKDPNTPEWVQHIAFEVENMDDLLAAKSRLEAESLDVLGPVDHTIFKSIYFFDPNGHRLELTTNTAKSGMLEELHKVAPEMIAEWSQTKKAPKHAAWLHDGSFGSTEQNKQEK
jgi:catechol-2,3-dioxygenase